MPPPPRHHDAALPRGTEPTADDVTGPGHPDVQERPLSSGERALWALQQVTGEASLATVVFSARLSRRPDAAALERALRELCRRHDVLRTSYAERGGEPYALVGPALAPTLHRRTVPDPTGLTAMVAAERQRPFDLTRAPLVAATLVSCTGDGSTSLLLTLPHVVVDLWSARLLADDLGHLYDVEVGVARPASTSSGQYVDFARWESDFLDSGQAEVQRDHWRRELAAVPTTIDLPTDRPRPARQSKRSGSWSTTVTGELRAQVEGIARVEGTTAFTVLLAGLQVVVHRWSGQPDVVLGTPSHGRNRAAWRDTAGLFVNTVPLRSRLGGDDTFRRVLASADRSVRQGLRHARLPFAELVRSVAVPHDPSRAALCPVVLAFQTTPSAGPSRSSLGLAGPVDPDTDLAVGDFGIQQALGEVDLSVMVAPQDDGYRVPLDYAVDLFDEGTVAAVGRSWLTVLDAATRDLDARVVGLPLLTPDERAARLAAMTGDALDLGVPDTLPEVLRRTTARDPGAVALLDDRPEGVGRRWTYADLLARAELIARHLVARGVRRGDRVGVCVPRSFEAVASLCGVLAAGAAYVPLDPTYAPARLRSTAEDAGCATTLVTAGTEALVGWGDARLLVDADLADLDDVTVDPPVGSDAAYVIYTSGSTGRPKGVVVEHRSVVNHNAGFARLTGLGAADRLLQFHSLSFDASVEEIFPTLMAGASLVVPVDTALRAPVELERLVSAVGITLLDLPTAYWHQWVESMSTDLRTTCPTLRRVTIGGEAAASSKLLRWQEQGGPVLANSYGPTEATVVCTLHEPEPVGAGIVPIGRPLPNTQSYVLDALLEPVPVGLVGELYVGGVGVARGYLDRPGLTTERFLDNPHGPGRLYRTGDVVRTSPNGSLEFLGRRDRQVKPRGFRVEPGEVEAALAGCAGVLDAAVVVRPTPSGDPRLVAFVTGSADAAALRDQLAGVLPPYLVPQTVVVLDAMPMTGSDKIDYAALPELATLPTDPSDPVTPTLSAEEARLARVWSEVLGLAGVGRDDNFFALGGDSISAIRVVARAAADGLTITARQLFEHQTVAELAAVAGAAQSDVERTPATGEQPLLPMQRWFFDQNLTQPQHWTQSVLLDPRRPVDVAALGRALDAVVARHDALRLAFRSDEAGRWHASYVERPAPVEVRNVRLTASDEDRAAEIDAHAGALHASHALAAPPLLKVISFEAGDEPAGLLLSAHHLVVDAVSWSLLIDDLERAYGAEVSGTSVTWAFPSASLAEWSGDEAAVSSSACSAEEQADLESGTGSVAVVVDEPTTAALLRSGSLGEQLVAATARALGPDDGRDEPTVLVDVERHGRDQDGRLVDVSRTVGWFTQVRTVAVPTTGDDAGQVAEIRRQLTGRDPQLGGPGVASVNYLGVLDLPPRASEFAFVRAQVGANRGPMNRRPNRWEVDAALNDGRLEITVAYGARDTEVRARAVADRIHQALAGHPDTRAELELTPLQRGILVDSLAAEGVNTYVGQLVCRFDDLDVPAFEAALDALVRRHDALRTSFAWTGRPRPVQVVDASATLRFRIWDGPAVEEDELSAVLDADLAEPVGWDGPPHRWTVVRAAGGGYAVWTHHHLLVDGWSLAIVLGDLFELYAALRAGRPEPAAGTSSSVAPYLDWFAHRDAEPVERYWRGRLGGVTAPTVLSPLPTGTRTGTDQLVVELTEAEALQIADVTRRERVTTATLFQAAWALVLARRTGSADVVFGAVTAGRSAPVGGIDAMVGLLSNSLPIRIDLDDRERVSDWLRRLQREDAERRDHEQTTLSDVQRVSGIPRPRPMFESLLVVENYPVADALAAADGVGLQGIRLREALDQPLGIEIAPGRPYRLTLTFRHSHFDRRQVADLADDLRTALRALADGHSTLGALRRSGHPTTAPVAAPPSAVRHDARPPWSAPLAGVEADLAAAWAEVLAAPAPGRHDDFFALGGDSLQAIRLVDECRRRLGLELPLKQVFEHPTLAGLAAALVDDVPTTASPLLTLRRGTSGPALYLVHPLSGRGTVFGPLAPLVPGYGDVHAFESVPTVDGPRRLQELAEQYAAEIEARSDDRTTVLAGYSLGAIIAVEVARLLAGRGRPVEHLILLDPAVRWGTDLPDPDLHELMTDLAGLEGLAVPVPTDLDPVAALHAAARWAGRPLGALDLPAARRLVDAAAVHHRMLQGHEVHPYAGGADLVLVDDHAHGWCRPPRQRPGHPPPGRRQPPDDARTAPPQRACRSDRPPVAARVMSRTTRSADPARSRAGLGADFAWLFRASAASNVADGLRLAAAPLLVASTVADPRMVAAAFAVQRLPWLVCALPVGALVDRVRPVRALTLACTARAACAAGLAAVVVAAPGDLVVLYAPLFVGGLTEVVADTTATALAPVVVASADLTVANSRIALTQVVGGQLVGPVAGALLFTVDRNLPFALEAVGCVVAALAVNQIRPGAEVAGRAVGGVVVGVRWLWAQPELRRLIVLAACTSVTFGGSFSIMVLYAERRLGLASAWYGVLLAVAALGGLVGALVAPGLVRRAGQGTVLRFGLLAEALVQAGLALTHAPGVAGVLVLIFGAQLALLSVTTTTIRHRLVPRHLSARVASAYLLASTGGVSAGGLLAGPLAHWSLSLPFAAAAVIDLLVAALFWRRLGDTGRVAQPVAGPR
ncbi:non-ribosomal peptide synthetase [Microlunatus flavus]|uniref:Amino acid adenylation domain-containing protein n=1 Tax=Microlunatus flavus TaxID=1036181 RepID=A0A1H9JLL4_9ACTN|nr:non-ribosomal peptide synthetase [Microlunatus flavus]SEQ87628.1 amino acid adenylation domain-containing protein [Microlunatus flavus]